MGNDNYHESMEKNRQELSQERMAELTRRARQMPKPKSRGLLLPSLFFIFILIPVTLLIYVAFYYEPDDTLTAKTNENEVSFELNSQPPSDSTVLAAADDQEKDEEEKKSTKAKEAQEQKELKEKAREREEKAAAKEKEKAAAEQQAEKKAQETALAEQKAREEAEAEAEAKAKAKAKAEAEQRAQAEEKEKEEQQETPTAGGKTVTVQSSETLYRIAVNNYGASGAAAAVEKIKQANGLASNDISPGQTLILP